MFRKISIIGIGMFFVVSMITMVLAPPANAAYEDVFLDAKAYWALDEAGGNIAYDTAGTGNHYDGTLVSAPTRTTGKVGGALTFNGASQSVSLPATGDWNVRGNLGFASNENWSASLWYKGTDTGENGVFGKGLIAWNSVFTWAGLVIRNGYAEYIHYNGGWQNNIKSSTFIADGEWHHVAWNNRDNGTGDLYIDGTQEVFGVSSVISNNAFFQPKELAAQYGNAFTQGAIDEVALWGRTLTSGEIQTLASPNAGNPVPEPATVVGMISGLLMLTFRRVLRLGEQRKMKKVKKGIRN